MSTDLITTFEHDLAQHIDAADRLRTLGDWVAAVAATMRERGITPPKTFPRVYPAYSRYPAFWQAITTEDLLTLSERIASRIAESGMSGTFDFAQGRRRREKEARSATG